MCNKYNISYIIVVGKPNLKEPIMKRDILMLNCEDSYCELPDKIYKLNYYFNDFFPKSDGYLKIDDDVIFCSNPELYYKKLKSKFPN